MSSYRIPSAFNLKPPILRAGLGADETGFLGFYFSTEPILANVFFDNGKFILAAAGKIINLSTGIKVKIAFNNTFGILRILSLLAF